MRAQKRSGSWRLSASTLGRSLCEIASSESHEGSLASVARHCSVATTVGDGAWRCARSVGREELLLLLLLPFIPAVALLLPFVTVDAGCREGEGEEVSIWRPAEGELPLVFMEVEDRKSIVKSFGRKRSASTTSGSSTSRITSTTPFSPHS